MAGRYVEAGPSANLLVTDFGDRRWTLGSLFFDASSGYTYKFVQVDYATSNALAVGTVVYETSGNKNVVTDAFNETLGVKRPAGIALGTVAVGTATSTHYCWVLVDGDATVKVVTGVISAGDEISGSGVDGKAKKARATALAAGVGTIIGVCKVTITGAKGSISARVSIGQ